MQLRPRNRLLRQNRFYSCAVTAANKVNVILTCTLGLFRTHTLYATVGFVGELRYGLEKQIAATLASMWRKRDQFLCGVVEGELGGKGEGGRMAGPSGAVCWSSCTL